ncbi:hypothetical protein [Neptunomonas marina]|uniref:hypothetical protein n=1 Tax=Neptunomonas marina TaxID=1815562 RepID=UPI00198061DE|nr:hypothetical protein [Neptunomonas marina]
MRHTPLYNRQSKAKKTAAVSTLNPLALAAALVAIPATQAAAQTDVSLILDAYHKSDQTALGGRSEGFGLSHSELSITQSMGEHLRGKLTAVADINEDDSEFELEEAYLQTLTLPAGLTVKAGRFLADIGYLNSQHSHSDSFTERPLAYRGFLGGHYFDDGLGLSITLPTQLYWQVNAGIFTGDEFADRNSDNSLGIWTLSSKIGGDIGTEHSWQAGFSYVRNRTIDDAHDEHHHNDHDEEHEEDHDEEHDDHSDEHDADHDDHGHDDHDDGGHHGHSHGAEYTGKNIYIADVVWKWAPQGNNRQQQLKLAGEYIRVTDINEYAGSSDYHSGYYLSAVYRFLPEWSVGVRHGELDVKNPHGDHFHAADISETSVMVAWNPTHTQTVRLQYTEQDGNGFEDDDNAITLQYQIGFGSHAAHGF